jgi:hypothetical protein
MPLLPPIGPLEGVIALGPVGRWLATGSVGAVVGVWVVAVAVRAAASLGLSATVGLRVVHRPPRAVERMGDWVASNRVTRALARMVDSGEQCGSLRDCIRRGDRRVAAQALAVMTVLVAQEHLLFHGLPWAVGLSIVMAGGPAWLGAGVLVCGMTLWSVGHGLGRGLVGVATDGAVLTVLWYAGHGLLALGLHLGTDVVVFIWMALSGARGAGVE